MLIDPLSTQKNLLAFSGGVDSTSLFFILLENNIPFDMAIVNYKLREQSELEVKYALDLAQKYNKICYVKEYNRDKFSEKDARDFRYDFFDEIIENEAYETLITAHQLNDKLEWFMMQLARGAGVVELIGLEKYSQRKSYQVFRPLLKYAKDDLEAYLQKNNIEYFIDETNSDPKYKRNFFREKFSNDFIKHYKEGVKKSFDYLHNDIDTISNLFSSIKYKELLIGDFKVDDINVKLRFIDKELKKRGILLSKNTKDEIIKQNSIVLSHKYAVVIENNKVYISPYTKVQMDKKFKEWCRVKKIPHNIRPYLFLLDLKQLEQLF